MPSEEAACADSLRVLFMTMQSIKREKHKASEGVARAFTTEQPQRRDCFSRKGGAAERMKRHRGLGGVFEWAQVAPTGDSPRPTALALFMTMQSIKREKHKASEGVARAFTTEQPQRRDCFSRKGGAAERMKRHRGLGGVFEWAQVAPTWSWWPDSNRRPADYESAALPTEPHQQKTNA